MATLNRRDVYLPPKHREPIDGRRVGTRLDHEHDQNDAIKARLSFVEEFNTFIKSKEKKDDRKWFHHVINFLVYSNIYFLIMVLILKFGLHWI